MPSFFNLRRKGTASTFGRKKPEEPRKLPTYADQNKETTPVDQDSKKKEDDKKDEPIDAAKGREDEATTSDVQQTKPKGKTVVRDNQPQNREYKSAPARVGNAYQRLWSESTDYTLHPRNFKTNAYFIPNAIPLSEMLKAAIPLVARTNWIQKQEVGFNPYAVATGYMYLYYIQILRAKKAANDLIGQEASALSRFEKYNDLASIPIPEFLIPFYESIVSTQMEDTKYAWIVPNWTTPETVWPNYAGTTNMMTATELDHIRPNIPFMLANLATYGCQTAATYFDRFDANRIFSPVSLTDNANPPVRRNNLNMMNTANLNMGNAGAHTASDFMTTLGVNFPFQFWNDNHRDANQDLADSKFFTRGGINLVLSTTDDIGGANANYVNPSTGEDMLRTIPLNSMDKYLFIAKENSPIWFEYIRDQMVLFVKHYPTGLTSLAQIATTGGLEATIIGQLKFEDQIPAPAAPNAFRTRGYVFNDLHCMQNNEVIRFYPKIMENLHASFVTARSDIEREHVMQAFSIGINSNPPFAVNNNVRIRSGKLFEHDLTQRQTVRGYLGQWGTTTPGEKPMYQDFRDYVRDGFVLKPE